MAILINHDTEFLVQGITEQAGSFHTAQMLAYGTSIVAGVTPEMGGAWEHGIPVFDNIRTATEATGANSSIIFGDGPSAVDAIYEAVDEGLRLVICVTDGIPTQDSLKLKSYLDRHPRTRLIGPGSPGVLVPGRANAGIVPGFVASEGKVGVVSRSASVAYEGMALMSAAGFGQSTFVGVGSDAIVGTSYAEVLALFEEDPETSCIILMGEVGGAAEIEAAAQISIRITKPVIAFLVGRSAIPFVRMGHAGAIITTPDTTVEAKEAALKSAGALIAHSLEDVVSLLHATGHASDQ
ncbi:MAG: succinate--CoA ligase subunit alpha [Anaerolineae bacterium]|nr:succinate--CoA ligase subunit alpha [Anaerolineae bacterium]